MTTDEKTLVFPGTVISPGMAMGHAFVYHDVYEGDFAYYDIEAHQVDEEYRRIEQAIAKVLEDLSLSAKRVEHELEHALGDVFHAHESMLQDISNSEELKKELEREQVNAEHALHRVFKRWEQRFRNMESAAFRQRGDDVADLGRRLLRALTGVHAHVLESMPEGRILVARHLLPSETEYIANRAVIGMVLEFGGPGSHAALLTRAMGIPGLCQVPGVFEKTADNDWVLLDGQAGTVTVAPDRETRERFKTRQETYHTTALRAQEHAHEPAITLDGRTIPVLANIGNEKDARAAAAHGADGVGLFRTEMFHLSSKSLPTEDELVENYRRILLPMQDKSVVIRLLDVGGDKNLPYLQLPFESNPFLGQRGVRMLLHYPQLLATQLRAILRLSDDFDLQIMVPMVTVPEDMQAVRKAMEQAAVELGVEALPPLGAMVETPAAALDVTALCRESDFLSIGTNDLTQYTMAADRENAHVFSYFRDDSRPVMRLLEIIGAEAGETPVCICGELAGRREVVERLLQAGIHMLSIAPPLVPGIKEAVRACRIT